MFAWQVHEWGLDNLKKVELEEPEPGPDEIKVRFEAVSLNYRDLLVVSGKYNPRFPRPLIPCSDGYGTITAVGRNLDDTLIGRKFITLFCPGWRSGEPCEADLRNTLGGPRDGALSEYAIFRPEEVLLLEEPSALTPAEWATLPCAGVTAWNCLTGLTPGQSVLLIGTGGVSLFALQLSKMFGARVLLLSSSQDKRERALELGADSVADYKTNPNWGKWVLEQTDGQGVDYVVETGGAGTLSQSLKAVRVGGHISLIGVLSGHQESLNILPLVMKAVQIRGIVVGNKAHSEALVRAYLQSMQRPVVSASFGFDDVPSAFEMLGSAAHFGNIAIEFPMDDTPQP